jgi:hypothetical protein
LPEHRQRFVALQRSAPFQPARRRSRKWRGHIATIAVG